jgi:hypothetical protein
VVHEVRIRGTRDGDYYGIRAGRIEVRDASDGILWSQDVSLPVVGGSRDADVPVVPSVAGVRSVRFTSTDDGSYSPGLAELRVLGEADLGPAREAKQDVVFRGTGRLEVTVKRADGSVVPDSLVWISDGTQPSGKSRVDSAGTFEWRILPPRTYTVFAQHPTGSPEISVDGIAVNADAQTRQDLVFEAFGSITGRVTTAKDTAIAAGVRLEAEGFQARSTSLGTTGSTASRTNPWHLRLTVPTAASFAKRVVKNRERRPATFETSSSSLSRRSRSRHRAARTALLARATPTPKRSPDADSAASVPEQAVRATVTGPTVRIQIRRRGPSHRSARAGHVRQG